MMNLDPVFRLPRLPRLPIALAAAVLVLGTQASAKDASAEACLAKYDERIAKYSELIKKNKNDVLLGAAAMGGMYGLMQSTDSADPVASGLLVAIIPGYSFWGDFADQIGYVRARRALKKARPLVADAARRHGRVLQDFLEELNELRGIEQMSMEQLVSVIAEVCQHGPLNLGDLKVAVAHRRIHPEIKKRILEE